MPQITNTTNADIWFPQLGVTVPANSFVVSDVYPVTGQSGQAGNALVIPAGLQVNSSYDAMDPLWDNTQIVQANTTYQLPATIVPRSVYSINIYCASGTCGVRFNSTLNKLMTLAATNSFVITCQSRTIDTIYLYPAGGGTTYVTVRKA